MQVNSLKAQIEKTQKLKKDQTLSQAAKAKGIPLAPIRTPPSTKCRRTLKGHFGKITAMHWGGDSKVLVSAAQDGNVLVWNAVTANKIQSIALKSAYVMAVAIEQSKGNLVACGGLDNLCTVYQRSEPSRAIEMASHDGFLSCCRFISESEMITASGDSTCIYWDIPAAKPIASFAEHTADAMHVALQPRDRNVFLSCSVDQTIKLWDIRTPKAAAQTFYGPQGDVNCVEFMPADGNCFCASSQDNSVRVFDVRAHNELVKLGGTNSPPGTSEGFLSCAFSRSGRIVFAGHADGSLFAFDVLAERNVAAFSIVPAHERNVSCMGVSPHGNALCTGSWDTVLKIWA